MNCLLKIDIIYIANLGDSEAYAVMENKKQIKKFVKLTTNHNLSQK